jgi:electron transport complex protein RnfC
MPCIRCGACADACPAELLPQQLYWYTRSNEFDKVEEHNVRDCIECGCCAYVCPSEIPLVDYFRFAKASIKTSDAEKTKSDKARVRYEERNERIERIKAARKARLNKKKAAIKK